MLITINLVNFGLMRLAQHIWPGISVLDWGADWGLFRFTIKLGVF